MITVRKTVVIITNKINLPMASGKRAKNRSIRMISYCSRFRASIVLYGTSLRSRIINPSSASEKLGSMLKLINRAFLTYVLL